jgi:hypothetical protein
MTDSICIPPKDQIDMRSTLATLLFPASSVWACGRCADTVDAWVYGQDFALNVVRMLAPLALVMAVALIVHLADK